jgi:hypothetical protein
MRHSWPSCAAWLLLTSLVVGAEPPTKPGNTGGPAPSAADPGGRQPSQILHVGRKPGTGKAFRLFILSGQSNMAAMNASLSFVPALEQALPNDELLVVKHASSGQPIKMWYKEWAPVDGWANDKQRVGSRCGAIYDDLMGMVRKEVGDRTPDSISFVWMQGEADGVDGSSQVYEQSLRGLIAQLRKDLQRQDLPVIIGRISDYQQDQFWNQVRDAQMHVAKDDPATTWVDCDDLNGKNNGLHYPPDGYKALGERFAAKAVQLLPRK